MSFLDEIAQHNARTRPRMLRPNAVPDVFRNEVSRVVTTERAQTPAAPEPPHTGAGWFSQGATWFAVFVVVMMIATGAWLGLQRISVSRGDNENAIAEDAVADPTEASAAAPASKRPKARRSATRRTIKPAAIVAAPDESISNVSIQALSPPIQLVSDGEEVGTPETDTAAADVPLPAPAIDNDSIYSRASSDVIAPKLVSLGFVGPLVNGFDIRRSSIELLISKNGTVERAKLLSVGSRNYEDALLLSRAKNLHFAPALRYGSPVRYRYVLEVALAP
jgi:hypothetical protein